MGKKLITLDEFRHQLAEKAKAEERKYPHLQVLDGGESECNFALHHKGVDLYRLSQRGFRDQVVTHEPTDSAGGYKITTYDINHVLEELEKEPMTFDPKVLAQIIRVLREPKTERAENHG